MREGATAEVKRTLAGDREKGSPRVWVWSGLYSITDNWVTLGQCSTLSLLSLERDLTLARVGGSPAVGQQCQHCQQHRDENEDERQRQDERVQVWKTGRRSGRFAGCLAHLVLLSEELEPHR